MNKIQAAIGQLEKKLPGILKELATCKDIVYEASGDDPDNAWIKEMHKRLWESEVAALQTQDILTTLTRTELTEDD